MKQQDRARMRIGGEEVVEIDINASYLTILHGISGFALPDRDDIYDISGIDRVIVKAWITSTIDHHCFQRIVLDTICGGVWYEHLSRPECNNLTNDQA